MSYVYVHILWAFGTPALDLFKIIIYIIGHLQPALTNFSIISHQISPFLSFFRTPPFLK